MANTIVKTGLTIDITDIDEDWLFSATVNDTGLYISSIQFSPIQTGDKCVIKEGGATGAIIFDALCADAYDHKIKYFHGERKQPFLDFGDGSFAAGTRILIEISEISG